MKVFVLVLCTVAGASASEAVAWPGAIKVSSYSSPLTLPYSALHASEVKTVIPGAIEGFGYSTSQYINAIPPGYQPHVSYQISIPGYPSYQPVLPPYYPSNSFLYPSLSPVSPVVPAPVGPVPPQPPFQNLPGPPAQEPAGDEDTAVIESAEFLPNQQQQPQFPPQNFPTFQPSLDAKNQPEFPQIPQNFQQTSSFSQQQPGSDPSQAPPSNIPPSSPSSPPSPTSPSDNSSGANDEDTVAVDAA